VPVLPEHVPVPDIPISQFGIRKEVVKPTIIRSTVVVVAILIAREDGRRAVRMSKAP
jgi:hypothetical protein